MALVVQHARVVLCSHILTIVIGTSLIVTAFSSHEGCHISGFMIVTPILNRFSDDRFSVVEEETNERTDHGDCSDHDRVDDSLLLSVHLGFNELKDESTQGTKSIVDSVRFTVIVELKTEQDLAMGIDSTILESPCETH